MASEERAHAKRRHLADLGLQSSQPPGIGSERRLGAPGDALTQQECLNALLQGVSRGFLGVSTRGPTAETRVLIELAGPEGIEPL